MIFLLKWFGRNWLLRFSKLVKRGSSDQVRESAQFAPSSKKSHKVSPRVFLKCWKSFFHYFETFLNKNFESLPRMIQSSTRIGGGHFFFETAELVVALGSSGGPS